MINIIIPAYNCCTTLDRTLASLVAQTDTAFEIIIIDDCSTEDIKTIIDNYINKLSIIYLRNEQNLGPGMTRQVGIDNATQKFITFLDSDDIFMPYAVETFNSIIASNPNIEYLHTYFYEQVTVDGCPALFVHENNYTAHHGKLYNVEVLNRLGIRNSPLFRYAEDAYFNSMCGELMEMSVIKIPTMLWVNNKNSMIRKPDPNREILSQKDLFNAMLLSAKFVLEKKGHIDHLKYTITHLSEWLPLDEEEIARLNEILIYVN